MLYIHCDGPPCENATADAGSVFHLKHQKQIGAGVVLAVTLVLSAGGASAQEPSGTTLAPKSVRMVHTDSPPIIDGKVDDAAWATAARIDDFHQIRPGNQTPPSERTEVYLAYDKDAIYVAARMWDSGAPREMTRNIMKQGSSLADDDRIAIVIDPFNSRRQGYRFEVNANGVRNDMLY